MAEVKSSVVSVCLLCVCSVDAFAANELAVHVHDSIEIHFNKKRGGLCSKVMVASTALFACLTLSLAAGSVQLAILLPHCTKPSAFIL